MALDHIPNIYHLSKAKIFFHEVLILLLRLVMGKIVNSQNSRASSLNLKEVTHRARDDFFWLGWGWGHVCEYFGVPSTITICKFLMVLHHRGTHHKHHSLDGNSHFGSSPRILFKCNHSCICKSLCIPRPVNSRTWDTPKFRIRI